MARFARFSLLVALTLAGASMAQAKSGSNEAAAQAKPASQELLKQGAAIAARNCGSCHATGRSGASPNPKSPPFRYLARRYPLANLEEALGEGIVVGHEGLDMPQFRFDSREIEALLAYLGSIQKR